MHINTVTASLSSSILFFNFHICWDSLENIYLFLLSTVLLVLHDILRTDVSCPCSLGPPALGSPVSPSSHSCWQWWYLPVSVWKLPLLMLMPLIMVPRTLLSDCCWCSRPRVSWLRTHVTWLLYGPSVGWSCVLCNTKGRGLLYCLASAILVCSSVMYVPKMMFCYFRLNFPRVLEQV